MLSLLLRGSVAGAALFGAVVAVCGGASSGLVVTFWGVGTLGVFAREFGATWVARHRMPRREP